jgi:two-component system sensor histidine kinase UhpB
MAIIHPVSALFAGLDRTGRSGASLAFMSPRLTMSLRLRLIVLPALIVLAGLTGLALYEVNDAKVRVRAETQSGIEMGRLLVSNAIGHADQAATPAEALARIDRDLPDTVRHVRLVLEPTGAVAQPLTNDKSAGRGSPAWFQALVGAPPIEERQAVTVGGQPAGAVALISQPDDEIAEVWRDWVREMALIGLVSASIVGVVVVAVALGLRPLTVLSEGFERLEQGDFTVQVGPFRDAELRRLGERFNRLVASLGQATDQNRLLINRLMSVQDTERKDIAHELHDEFGPSLFAIRADLGAISRRARSHTPPLTEVQERVSSISGLVEQIQRINSRLLERLRPLVLDQLGLREALERLVEAWAARYPATRWTVSLADVGEVDEQASHALYRAAQEALTNIVRHADARSVSLSLTERDGLLVLTVEDDGRGLADGVLHGFGLLGMAERARAVGGKLTVSAVKTGGARIVATASRTREEDVLR